MFALCSLCTPCPPCLHFDGEITMSAIIPTSRCPIATRAATMDDLPFLDGMQKQHSKALGYFPTKQFEGYIEMGGVLVASLSTEYSVPST